MANLTITPSNVQEVTGDFLDRYPAGVAIEAGQFVYLDANNKLQLASNTGTTPATLFGIALNTAERAEQEVLVMRLGDVAVGTILTVGEVYVLSDTAGSIRPLADLVSGDFVTIAGVATTTSYLKIAPVHSGVAKP